MNKSNVCMHSKLQDHIPLHPITTYQSITQAAITKARRVGGQSVNV